MSTEISESSSIVPQWQEESLSLSLRRRLFKDQWATRIVVLSGFSIIFVILAIFFVIATEVFPLFQSPEINRLEDLNLSTVSPPLAIGVDEYREQFYVVSRSDLQFFSLKGSLSKKSISLPELGNATIQAVSIPQDDFMVLSLSDGRALPLQINFKVSFGEGGRSVQSEFVTQEPLVWNENGSPVTLLAHRKTERGFFLAGVTREHEVTVIEVERRKTLMGTLVQKQHRETFVLPNKGPIRALAIGEAPDRIYAGTETGQIIGIYPEPPDGVNVVEVLGAMTGSSSGISTLGFLKGTMTLVAGNDSGQVSSFHFIRDDTGRYRMKKIHDFEPHGQAISAFSPSHRNKGFVTLDGSGTLKYHYGTTGATQYEVKPVEMDRSLHALITPKDNGLMMVNEKGILVQWNIHNPHPEISWDSLFGPMKYEGYEKADYVWQSTGGTDDFESKMSLMPLLFGTLKGTFYALLFAAPLALMAAFYTSQFMSPALTGIVKPTVEFMAAIPSVVLGFFGALWLAPRVETILPGLILVPLIVVGVVWGFQRIRNRWAANPYAEKNSARDFLGLLFAVTLAGALCWFLGPLLEEGLFDGNYKSWLNEVWEINYDQRNSLVVGLAMGFAVIPIIFTIAEDSLSNVPRHLSAASLAVGATPWQTAVQVILPAAIPGIFSGVMIGLGRAVGETMIVLMATGNTPIMDWSVFNGFRAMSANIAVELPEAPEGDTLFRVLFLTAMILFMITFVFNSLAEWVRLRLRKKYQLI